MGVPDGLDWIGRYWGKARPRDDQGLDWHPLAYHCLDVAAAMGAMLDARPAWLATVAAHCKIAPEEARLRLILVAAVHDLGKFADNFQQKASKIRERLQPDVRLVDCNRGHGDIGAELWGAIPKGHKPTSLTAWAFAAFAHHGAPVEATDSFADAATDNSARDAHAFTAAMIDLIGAPDQQRAEGGEWLVAGLVTLADWIGSNQTWFAYAPPDQPLTAYWAYSQERARKAVADARLVEALPSSAFGLTTMLGEGVKASPLQEWAEQQTPSSAPQLYVIEDLTGAGKSEAALILAHRLIAAGAAEGLFWALPTMATANGLYGRLERSYTALFSQDGHPSLVLAHGARDIHDGFQASIGRERDATYGEKLQGEQDISAEASCAAFVAEDRKKSFLAEVGVGTIDQALLAVLPVRHQSLRLAALSRRVLIIDEAHAYDPYMATELEGLLRFQAFNGGSTIVMSATLSMKNRAKLIEAYARGLGQAATSQAFPLVTHVCTGVVSEAPQPPARGSQRDLPVQRFETPETVINALLEKASQGACGVYVRNTVADALQAYEALKSAAPKGVYVELFHARYAICDRKTVENSTLARFGPNSRPEDRRGRILVATQVVEQSLDLDFDYMATDLCPMDLIIQRAGRLHRHGHRPSRPAPVLWVVGPEATMEVDADWYAQPFPIAKYVYPDVGQLWRTMTLLTAKGGLNFKTGSPRDFIEPVFGHDAMDIPAHLMADSDRAEAERTSARSLGHMNLLNPKCFDRQGGAWDSDVRTPTRLSEDTMTLRLARWCSGKLTPWYSDEKADRAWRLSEISVPRRWLEKPLYSSNAVADEVHAVQTQWPDRYEAPMILVLEPTEDAETWAGAWLDSGEHRVVIRYSARSGLERAPRPQTTNKEGP